MFQRLISLDIERTVGRFGQPAVIGHAGKIGHTAAWQNGRIGAIRVARHGRQRFRTTSLHQPRCRRRRRREQPLHPMRQRRQDGGDRRTHRGPTACSTVRGRGRRWREPAHRRSAGPVCPDPTRSLSTRPADWSSTCSICSSTEFPPPDCPPRPAAATAGYGPAESPGRSRPATCLPVHPAARTRSTVRPPRSGACGVSSSAAGQWPARGRMAARTAAVSNRHAMVVLFTLRSVVRTACVSVRRDTDWLPRRREKSPSPGPTSRRRPSQRAMLPRWHKVATLCPASTGMIGSLPEATHPKKFSMWLSLSYTRTASAGSGSSSRPTGSHSYPSRKIVMRPCRR
jgi:hypothetical protein